VRQVFFERQGRSHDLIIGRSTFDVKMSNRIDVLMSTELPVSRETSDVL
jgi:hypothetical protein